MCTDTLNPHVRAIADIVDRNLKAAKVSAKVRNDVQDALDSRESVTGQVGAVWTTGAGRTIFVVSTGGSMAHAEFKFPGNDPRFEVELIRAQSEGLMVTAGFYRKPGDVLELESIWTYAGASVSSPRY